MNIGERFNDAKNSLDQFYSQLNRKWEEAERHLRGLNLPVPASVQFKEEEPPGDADPQCPTIYHLLGFLEHEGEWRICYGRARDFDPSEIFWTPIHKCSLEDRIEAAKSFDALREKVLANVEDYVSRVESSVGALTEALSKG